MSAKVTIPIPEWLDKICTWPLTLYRRHKYGWPYRKIYLGQGKWTIVEPGDYYWLNEYNWYLSGNGRKFYAFTNIITGPGKTRMVSMHRLIMNPPAHLLVDHHNNNPLDNRRENFRLATHVQNSCNRGKQKLKSSSKYVGVSFYNYCNKWVARIACNYKHIWLGRFDDEIAAAKAYDVAARKYHGEFAGLNFQG